MTFFQFFLWIEEAANLAFLFEGLVMISYSSVENHFGKKIKLKMERKDLPHRSIEEKYLTSQQCMVATTQILPMTFFEII